MSESIAGPTPERLSTGSSVLDRQLDTGLRAGSLLAVRAPPASQSEGLLYTLMHARPTLFISTLRRERAVRRDLDRATERGTDFRTASIVKEVNMDSEMVKEITGERSLSATGLTAGSGPLDEMFELVRSLDERTDVIVDSVAPLERCGDEKRYRTVLNELKEQVMRTGGLGVLHCFDHDDTPQLRETTLSIADIVWELEHMTRASEQKYFLTVTKNRGESVVREKIELFLGRNVQIDETRNI